MGLWLSPRPTAVSAVTSSISRVPSANGRRGTPPRPIGLIEHMRRPIEGVTTPGMSRPGTAECSLGVEAPLAVIGTPHTWCASGGLRPWVASVERQRRAAGGQPHGSRPTAPPEHPSEGITIGEHYKIPRLRHVLRRHGPHVHLERHLPPARRVRSAAPYVAEHAETDLTKPAPLRRRTA